MKQLFSLAAATMLAACMATAQPSHSTPDTLTERNARYHYSEWYDSCALYYSDSAMFLMEESLPIAMTAPNRDIIAAEHYTGSPLTVVGLAALVSIDIDPQYLPPIHPGRAAEYMMIYQAGGIPATVPWEEQRYYPRELTLIDSVRWDTATPYIFKLPKRHDLRFSTADTDFTYCYVYEAYFDTPVTVDSLFYILGTHRSNILNRSQWEHWPTSYCNLNESTASYCDLCPQRLRVFMGYGEEFTGDNWVLRNFQRVRYTPLLPIVAGP